MENAKILIVEDEGIVAMDIRTRLSSLGFTVVGHASSGEQAIALAEQHKPDLILMDIKIKGPLDGIETAEQIQSRQSVPIIFLTAFADEPTLQRAKVTGPSGYILKPFEERELAIAIEMGLYKHEMEKNLRESEERYMLAIQGANDGIWDWNIFQNTIFFSQRWKEIIGYQNIEVGSTFEDWLEKVHFEDRDRLKLAFNHHFDGLSDHLECEVRMKHNDGSIRWVLTRGLAIRDQSNRPYRIAGSITDITDLKRAQEQLVYDAYHDALTGIPNRALFIDRLEQALERQKRNRNNALAVLFLDLDNFKIVNDSLGHLMGDELLVQVANRLQRLVRSSDTVARLGGDEFVILLESVNGIVYARNIAERIEEVLKAPILLDGKEFITTASTGIVLIKDYHNQVSDVLRDADIAMYRAKSLGKARFEVFEDYLRTRSEEQLDIEKCLINALNNENFKIHFQPIYSFPHRQLVGLEALLRLEPSGREPIPPSIFIPIAEEAGLIKEIGDWVLLMSCKKMNEWHKKYPHEAHLNLHVNISVKQIRNPGFVNRVQEILKISGLNPVRLKFEIKENAFVENIEQISMVLDHLSTLGVQVMIDNFGTGYSSLGYIRRFPIDTVKLDRNFIFPSEGDGVNAEIIKTVMILANLFGLKIVAEGVETEEQADYLKDMKCHFGQGFLFSKPLEMKNLEEYFKNQAAEF
jgi:diguanylate cyclase (GGDEF)-like protein/PAS domain S-box-containing protein